MDLIVKSSLDTPGAVVGFHRNLRFVNTDSLLGSVAGRLFALSSFRETVLGYVHTVLDWLG
ncbi:hypothetical protein ANAPC5_01258 [Anaplasma phagocytophilum]|nr:hypothetical protein ANAPC5_01258 [Anaplasma phagocytophilum]